MWLPTGISHLVVWCRRPYVVWTVAASEGLHASNLRLSDAQTGRQRAPVEWTFASRQSSRRQDCALRGLSAKRRLRNIRHTMILEFHALSTGGWSPVSDPLSAIVESRTRT